jgi:hypothetical protein
MYTQVESGCNHVYVVWSGEKSVCTRVAVRRTAYIFLWEGEGPYILISDIIVSYWWSAIDLWAEEVSSKLLRFGFLFVWLLDNKVVIRFW